MLDAATTVVAISLQRPLKPLYCDRNFSCRPKCRTILVIIDHFRLGLVRTQMLTF